MLKYILCSLFCLFAVLAQAQFRMVGNASWTTINDSTYSATITFQSDLTGQGYLPTQIVAGYQLFTPTEQLYRVDQVLNTTFSSAEVQVVEIGATEGAPLGQVMVFDPDNRSHIPQVPFGSTGATAQMQAAVDSYNARVEELQVIIETDPIWSNEKTSYATKAYADQSEADAKAYADANDDVGDPKLVFTPLKDESLAAGNNRQIGFPGHGEIYTFANDTDLNSQFTVYNDFNTLKDGGVITIYVYKPTSYSGTTGNFTIKTIPPIYLRWRDGRGTTFDLPGTPNGTGWARLIWDDTNDEFLVLTHF